MNTHTASDCPHVQALLVEGSAIARQMLQQVLDAAFTRPVLVAATVFPRDELPRFDRLDVALVDIDLDDRGALDLIGRLPEHCWRIATTLYDEDDRLLPAFQMGIHGYLLKQDRLERQVESLQRILRGKAEVSPSMARGLMELLSRMNKLTPIAESTLIALGKGGSNKETARALGIGIDELEAQIVHLFDSIRLPPAEVLANLD